MSAWQMKHSELSKSEQNQHNNKFLHDCFWRKSTLCSTMTSHQVKRQETPNWPSSVPAKGEGKQWLTDDLIEFSQSFVVTCNCTPKYLSWQTLPDHILLAEASKYFQTMCQLSQHPIRWTRQGTAFRFLMSCLSISEISNNLNFRNWFHFCKSFIKLSGSHGTGKADCTMPRKAAGTDRTSRGDKDERLPGKAETSHKWHLCHGSLVKKSNVQRKGLQDKQVKSAKSLGLEVGGADCVNPSVCCGAAVPRPSMPAFQVARWPVLNRLQAVPRSELQKNW